MSEADDIANGQVLRRDEGQNVGGRPLLLTPDLQLRIVANVRRCGKLSIGAQACGIHRATLNRWMRLGLTGAEPFRGFCEAVERARGEFALERVQRIAEAPEWQASAWLLERMQGDNFDRPRIVVDLNALPQMTNDQLEELMMRVFQASPSAALPADVASDDDKEPTE